LAGSAHPTRPRIWSFPVAAPGGRRSPGTCPSGARAVSCERRRAGRRGSGRGRGGLIRSAMRGVLDLAHALVLVTSPAIDGAQSASATLDWLNHHGYEHLAAQSVIVISAARPGAAPIDLETMTQHFLGRTRGVQVI